ncbi:MAG TPA: hypothetical protein DCQ45_09155 [Erysipelotrichaceae bacterium]|jgi:hypothetical protein|nr:hypothetical protein [Erysipelotrichaceae bacterium]
MITLYVIPLFFYLFKENIWLFSTHAPDHFLIGRRTPKSSSLPVMGFFLTIFAIKDGLSKRQLWQRCPDEHLYQCRLKAEALIL